MAKDSAHKSPNSAEDPAVSLIRSRISTIYNAEPNAKAELTETAHHHTPPSKHQKYMNELSNSGLSLAEIQTKWHEYYQQLPDDQKHQVWQEFYAANNRHKKQPETEQAPVSAPKAHSATQKKAKKQSVADLKHRLLKEDRGNQKVKLSAAAHFKSLLFGVGMGGIVLLVLLFSFFNERFVAPFITPSRSVSSTPIVIDPASTAVGPETMVVIPKINVEVPVVYDTKSVQEADIQDALEKGVVHYATTSNPGEKGNSVIVGHSSNNLFNSGKYKFAFVLLNQLEEGDTFSLTKNSKRYVYRIYEKKIVKPTDVSVLGSTDKPATATLITCDPPGTSLNRLIVVGEQISPDPGNNTASTASTNPGSSPTIVPGNAPSLWSRFTQWLTG
jgi:sortase A